MPAIDDQGHVDVDDVAFAQRLVIGNAVADDVVDRGADRLGIAAIIKRCRHCAVVAGKLHNQAVQRIRGDSWPHQGRDQIKGFSREPSRPAHALKVFGLVQFDAV